MYAKGKGNNSTTTPPDSQAREKLAGYVYEYLFHTGAKKAAQSFLSEMRWEKALPTVDHPGFLESWWCVFWDLYCAAPDLRENYEHSNEARFMQDYYHSNNAPAASPSINNQFSGNDIQAGMPSTAGVHGYYPQMGPHAVRPQQQVHPPHSQPSPHPTSQTQQQTPMQVQYPPGGIMGPNGPFQNHRVAPRPAMPSRGVSATQHLMPNTINPTRQPQGNRVMVAGPSGPPNITTTVQQRMPPQQIQMQQNYHNTSQIRSHGPSNQMVPTTMHLSAGGRPWPPTSTAGMHQNPGNMLQVHGHPSTPVRPPPHGMPQDPANTSNDSMYTMIKPASGYTMSSGGPDGMSLPSRNDLMPDHPDGLSMPKDATNDPTVSPAHELDNYLPSPFQTDHDENASAEILKVKESLEEDAKRFTKEPADSDYYIQ
ncbi:uncharacterized protein TRIADDRAFT_58910 [Trichoplax adhaerens]|uniref:Uncharacterized protein n=1 Tax=Trichoplax adhaerens TaxID=10228 RepID=B3S406_TRIAD|nr:hypothetical protein TRIADDRAFT_58910 [Trichoplax adhaerens]EDV22373.1 hypothetical protein TRIADDRAFT_58910 [Trichoplax adhaerens]|eukprot:XP_002114917.1 hypothetical protein TRIADDRAFT_58910 [Trichoplax adhaerens]